MSPTVTQELPMRKRKCFHGSFPRQQTVKKVKEDDDVIAGMKEREASTYSYTYWAIKTP